MARVLIFANGDLSHPDLIRRLVREDDYLIAADGGARHVCDLGFRPHLIIGDLDSLSSENLPDHVQVQKHPTDKDETDLELAMNHARSMHASQIIVLGALGGRTDQTLANIALLTNPRFSEVDVRIDDGVEEILVCREQVQLTGRSGDLVSLIPWGAEALGVSTGNLRWPLRRESLFPGGTRGISNEMLAEQASIHLDAGLLLVIHRRSV